jgi:two-component system, sensor histidine kinase and response regulator
MDDLHQSTAAFRIALLDDNPVSRQLVARILERHFGCRLFSCSTPEELLLHATETPPDLFLVDIMLGTLNGIEVCRKLKATAELRSIPVILFSSLDKPGLRLEALRAGAIDYLDKPFYPEEFIQRVRGCVERFRHQRILEAQTQEQEALLRVLCHDLRNSVGAAHTLLGELSEAGSQEEQRDLLDLSRSATQSALDLIGHVAEYRTLLDESRPFKIEQVNIARACEESTGVLGPAASAKGVKLLVEVPRELELAANRVVLVHNILNNLVNNAIKFSRPGDRVWITAATQPADSGLECVITVRDEGIGIPPSILDKLLKRKPVASRPGTAQESGTGMGITLVDLYARRCGGSVAIESTVAIPGAVPSASGTRVTLRFPLQTHIHRAA